MNMTQCYFCSSTEDIESHHIVPQRFDGSDADSNIVKVCHDCHWKLERLYNKDFWEAIGIDDPRAVEGSHISCNYKNCTQLSTHTARLDDGTKARYCDNHPPTESDDAEDFHVLSDDLA